MVGNKKTLPTLHGSAREPIFLMRMVGNVFLLPTLHGYYHVFNQYTQRENQFF
ncbi:hypothetical protein QUF54_06260 [Candidatus Marithioploca araucensis]|uniref:Uncharacterized protein n=1 Tax=Candidatus Marithioploca araucensis TaxID=70273 RepID=A0ABT7VTR0_9GAMM|nr:hypothetical protein [Candidatus Marithioploca araucensis]